MTGQIAAGVTSTASLPAPVEGWDTREAIADMPPKRAIILDNYFCGTDKLNIRPGYASHVTGFPASVETLMEYVPQAGSETLFAASGSAIYNATTAGAVGAPVITGLSNARLQYLQFGTAGGHFLIWFNGADTPQTWNGSAWANATIIGPTIANLIWGTAHQRRLWVGEKESLVAWYGAVNAIGGAFTAFSIQAFATRGGYIMAMGTWSRDGGDGQDDVAVFLTSEGQAVIYQGTDPASAATWSLVGVFEIGHPIGRRCVKKAGADLLIVTDEGVVPLSAILSIDRSQSERVALTQQVNKAFNDYVRAYGSLFGWEPFIYPRRFMLLFNVPISSTASYQVAFNTLTKAPSRFLSIPAACWSLLRNDAYFGSFDGTVYKFDGTGVVADNGAAIVTDGLQAFNYFGSPGRKKSFKLARPVFEGDRQPSVAVDMNVDFRIFQVSATATPLVGLAGTWDGGLWDEALWGGERDVYDGWIGVRGIGRSGAQRMKTSTTTYTGGWIATDFIYVLGGQV